MTLFAAIALFGLAGQAPQQPQAAAAGSLTLFGQAVVPAAPRPGVADYPADVKAWSGWGPFVGNPVSPFHVDADWSALLAKPGALAPAPDALPWRVKVFLIPSVDLVSPDASGNLVERRTGIYKPTKDRIIAGLALAAGVLQAETGGHLAVSYDTTEDPALFEETVAAGKGLGAQALEAYVAPRINGGNFEANDKLYHGPYHVCLVIHAGLAAPSTAIASNTPTFALPAPQDDATVSAYAAEILRDFRSAAGYWAARHGRMATAEDTAQAGLPAVFGAQTPDQIGEDVDLGPIPGHAVSEAMRAGPYAPSSFSDIDAPAPSPMSANARLSVIQDTAKGAVLDAQLGGVFYEGGFAVPLPKLLSELAGQPDHILTFEVKTGSPDAIFVGAVGPGNRVGAGVALGSPPIPGPAVPVPADAAWHSVEVDLSQLPNVGSATGLYIGFAPTSLLYPKASIEITEYRFANFALVASPPPGALSETAKYQPPWEARASAARAAAAAQPPDAIALGQALADANDSVRLNALIGLAATKAPGLEDKIAACMDIIEPRVTEAAISALAFQDTPTAWATLQQVLRVGPGTHTKVVAAEVVARRKDPASAGQISALQGATRDWHDRLALARALAQNGTPQALTFLRAFLDDADPAVRAATAELAPADDDAAARKLMFVSVNDPSDSARAAACMKLLQSPTPEFKREGYRGANDDSWPVRVAVLDWIAAHPSADDRPALRQAVVSPYGAVRAAALRAFAASRAPVMLDDIANVLKDEDPVVQRELIALATAKKLVLPSDSLDVLKASPAPDVVQAAKSLQAS